MSFRNVMIESPAKVSLKREQLIVATDREYSLPVEDLSALLLENRQSTITTAALSRLGQSGCAVFVCDEKHMPCAVLMPFAQHSRTLAAAKTQLDASEPLKKRMWQQIIEAKISNQAACLRWNGKEDAALAALADRVKSGDAGNVEATAAQQYFPLLFGPGFTRQEDNAYNAGLNYGYAILRGYMARCLAVYGFLPAFGIHHCSTLNSMNLADDLMEPFRPLADLLVSTGIDESDELGPEQKRMLFNCLNLDVIAAGKHHSTAYAMELLVQSFARSLQQKKAALIVPEITELRQHRYE